MYRAPRGTNDRLPTAQRYWRYVEDKAVELTRRFAYKRIDTPVFEESDLFVRTVGEDTDVMDKETYTFQDRGNDYLTLRPEGTAPVCRAYLEHGMGNLPQPVRLYYFSPVFRYDRPQKGRYRQHHQFGIEVIGSDSPLVDVEVIECGWALVSNLGLTGLRLSINSIGDNNCRPQYVRLLKKYYEEHIDSICEECRNRLKRNPLRLLDCKQDLCQPLQKIAPASHKHLCIACDEHWTKLQEYLEMIDIPFTVDHKLVRGLDYYSRTVFEIIPAGGGSQSTILGGGRYDGLIERLGGKPTPGVGFATGIERIILNLEDQSVSVDKEEPIEYMIIALDQSVVSEAVKLASSIRKDGGSVIVGPSDRSLRGQMRNANTLGVAKVIIIGEDEISNGTLVIKNMTNGEQEVVAVDEFINRNN